MSQISHNFFVNFPCFSITLNQLKKILAIKFKCLPVTVLSPHMTLGQILTEKNEFSSCRVEVLKNCS